MTACLSYCMTASRIYEAGASYVRYFDLTLMFGMKLECRGGAQCACTKKSLDPFFYEDIAF